MGGASDRPLKRIRDGYAVRKKPHGLAINRDRLVPFVPMESIPQDGTFEAKYSVKALSEIRSATYFECGDLLVAKITPCFENGKQAIANALPGEFGYATTEVIPLYPVDDNEDARFLFYVLLHPSTRASIAERMEGSTARRRVPVDILLDVQYPYFPGDEQRGIADALGVVRSAIALESDCARIWQRTLTIALRQLFTHGLRGEAQKESEIGAIPSSWMLQPLGTLGHIGNGSTPKRTIADYWEGGTFPWLNSAKVYEREITLADQFVTQAALRACHLPQLKAGTVLVAITGQGKTLGHCAVLQTDATISQHLAYIALDQTLADPSFIRSYLETQYEHLRQIASGGGSTKAALTCKFLRDLKMPVPPIEEQREIVEIVDAANRKLELHGRKRAVLEDLFKALLNGFMSGDVRVSDLNLSTVGRVTEGQKPQKCERGRRHERTLDQ